MAHIPLVQFVVAVAMLEALPARGQGLDRSYAVPKAVWLQTIKAPLPHTVVAEEHVPSEFDWRNVNGRGYVTLDLNQHVPKYCGSCYLHAAISTLSDRIKIARKAASPDVLLSRQEVLNCGTDYVNGCAGGSADAVFRYMHDHGVPDETCMPYASEDQQCDAQHQCMNCDIPSGTHSRKCYPVQRYTRYFVSEYGVMEQPSIHEMKAEIFSRGPIACSLDCHALRTWPRGTVCNKTEPDGKEWDLDHEISITGWGIDDVTGVEYWTVRNSWGTPMGDAGWHRVGPIGKNPLGIETQCTWAVPQFPGVVGDYGPNDRDHDFPSGDILDGDTGSGSSRTEPDSGATAAVAAVGLVLAIALAGFAGCYVVARRRVAVSWATTLGARPASARLVEAPSPAVSSLNEIPSAVRLEEELVAVRAENAALRARLQPCESGR